MIGDLVAGIAARAAPEEAICARSRAWPMARRCATLPGRLGACWKGWPFLACLPAWCSMTWD